MKVIEINNPELENFIISKYGNDNHSLVNDFLSFIKTELIINDIKKGFEEVELYKSGKKNLNDVDSFILDLKSAN
jgi:hypothetical protein